MVVGGFIVVPASCSDIVVPSAGGISPSSVFGALLPLLSGMPPAGGLSGVLIGGLVRTLAEGAIGGLTGVVGGSLSGCGSVSGCGSAVVIMSIQRRQK